MSFFWDEQSFDNTTEIDMEMVNPAVDPQIHTPWNEPEGWCIYPRNYSGFQNWPCPDGCDVPILIVASDHSLELHHNNDEAVLRYPYFDRDDETATIAFLTRVREWVKDIHRYEAMPRQQSRL